MSFLVSGCSHAAGESRSWAHGYDAASNRKSLTAPDGSANIYNYNTLNRLSTLTNSLNGQLGFSYDANGNTLSDASASFTWDFENRLTQAVVPGTNGGTTTFKYDPFGRRIQKSGPLGTTNYLYDGANLLEELDSSGNVLARYTHGVAVDEDLATLRNGTSSYYQQDGLGSITSLSSSAGALAQTYAYDNFGKVTASTGTLTNPFQYTGHEFDSESGLYFDRARYFDPSAGRFLSQDPIRFRGGLNFYACVRNNPVVFKDVFGYQGCNAAQWAQSPNACAGPQSPNAPYQGPDGLWYNVPEWHSTTITFLATTRTPDFPPNDNDVLLPGNCECNLTNLLEWAREMQTEATNEDEQTVWGPWGAAETTGAVTLTEWLLGRGGLEGIAEWIPGVDLAFLGHDYFEIWEHHQLVNETIRMRFRECGSNW